MYRSHPSMGKAGKYGARSNGQGLELSRNMKRSLGAMAVRAFGLHAGLQLDYSTRRTGRTKLVHDVTLGAEEGAGQSVCLLSALACQPAQYCGRPMSCRPAALTRKTVTGFVGWPTNYFAHLLAQNKSNHRHVLPAHRGGTKRKKKKKARDMPAQWPVLRRHYPPAANTGTAYSSTHTQYTHAQSIISCDNP